MSSSIDNLAKTLQQAISEKDARKTSSYDGPAVVDSIDGDTIWVRIPGGEDRTPVQRTIDASEGDNIVIRIANHKAWAIGNSTSPPSGIIANQALANSITANQAVSETNEFVMENSRIVNADIQNVKAKNAEIENVAIQNARITNSFIDGLTAEDSEIRHSKIEGFTVIDGVVQGLQADRAEIYGTLNAHEAVIDNLDATYATIDNLETNYAHITNGVIDNAKIGYADVNDLNAHYANIDLANVNNAWIENGVVKDAAISDAQIIGVSANKLTAGTIDASNITVTNLNADNITTGTINGQRIGAGSLSLDKLSEEVPTKEYLDNVAENLQGQIDGQIETWTGNEIPTLQNSPAVNWGNNSEKHKHVGDIYYVVNTANEADGYTYRFTESGTVANPTYSWTLIKDNQITKALQDILDIQGDITGIKSFDSQISSWKTDTDEELSSLKSRTSTLETDMGNKVSTTTFNELKQTVDENSASITSLGDELDTKADGSTVSTLSNTVNTIQQTTNSNSSTISQLTTTLGTNADGTTKENDIVHRASSLEQDLSGFKTNVSETYYTKESGSAVENRVSLAESTITQHATEIDAKVSKNGVIASINASVEEEGGSAVKIHADKVNIEGAAIFTGTGRLSADSLNDAYDAKGTAANAVSNLTDDLASGTGTTVINGGHIAAGTLNLIGDSSSKNVYIDQNSTKIRDGSTILAEFGSDVKLNKPDGTTAATLNTDGLNMTAGSITLGSYFSVSKTGVINATSGSIGGFDITGQIIQTDNTIGGNYYRSGMQTYIADSAAAFYAGCKTSTSQSVASPDSSNFFVRHNGQMYCKEARIETLRAESEATGVSWVNARDGAFLGRRKSPDTTGAFYPVLSFLDYNAGDYSIGTLNTDFYLVRNSNENYTASPQVNSPTYIFKSDLSGNVEIGNTLKAGSNIRLPNNTSLQGLHTNGSTWVSLIYLGNDNKVYVGNNSYNILLNGTIGGSITMASGMYINAGSNIRLPNNVSLQGATTGGAWHSLIYVNSSNNIAVGDSSSNIVFNSNIASSINMASGMYINAGSNIRLPNGVSLQGNTTIGVWRSLISMNSNNEVAIGHSDSYIVFNSIINSNITIYGTLTTSSTISSGGNTMCSTDNAQYCGNSSHRWKDVYSMNSTNKTSDRKEKDVLGEIGFAEDLIMKLEPIQYMWKNGDHRRKRMGFIAQDASDVCKELNENLSFVYASYGDEGMPDEKLYLGEDVDDELLHWGLRYDELIAPIVAVVQKQHKDILTLKEEIEHLKGRMAS